MHKKDMKKDSLGTCEVCHREPAKYIMWPVTNDRNDPSYAVRMCNECAWEAFESGTHEAENDYSESPHEGRNE